MASPITDPKHFAQHVNEQMLADFLHAQTPPIPFKVLGDKPTQKKRVNENAVNRFIETIQNLPGSKRDELFIEILDINKLSSGYHMMNIEKQAIEEGIVYDKDDYGKCSCYDERSLWWYIHHRDLFDRYFEKADTENLAGLRELMLKDQHIVEKEFVADEEKLSTIGEGVAKLYENTLRGRRFKVSHFLEKGSILVRVYLENLPDNQLVFTDNKNTVGRTPTTRSLFSIIFIYSPDDKMLGIRSDKPSENVPKLADLFCKTFLNCTYADTTERKYNVEDMGSIERMDLVPEPMSDIERVYLKAVHYSLVGDSTKTLILDIGGRQDYTGTEAMQLFIKQSKIVETEWRPKRFEIKFIFRKADAVKGKQRQITVSLSKRGYNLKNTPEDPKIRQFLKAKGFIS